jgi:hypothetical protein
MPLFASGRGRVEPAQCRGRGRLGQEPGFVARMRRSRCNPYRRVPFSWGPRGVVHVYRRRPADPPIRFVGDRGHQPAIRGFRPARRHRIERTFRGGSVGGDFAAGGWGRFDKAEGDEFGEIVGCGSEPVSTDDDIFQDVDPADLGEADEGRWVGTGGRCCENRVDEVEERWGDVIGEGVIVGRSKEVCQDLMRLKDQTAFRLEHIRKSSPRTPSSLSKLPGIRLAPRRTLPTSRPLVTGWRAVESHRASRPVEVTSAGGVGEPQRVDKAGLAEVCGLPDRVVR